MATVLDRFNKLGLASSKPVLIKAGELVSAYWLIYANTKQVHDSLYEKSQIENDESIMVNDYPEFFVPYMDEVILDFVK